MHQGARDCCHGMEENIRLAHPTVQRQGQQDQKWSIDAISIYGWQQTQQIFCLIIYSGFIIYFCIVESDSYPHFLQS